MVVTSTSIAFILLGLGLGLCGWFFLKAFNESSSKIPRIQYLLSIFLVFSSLQNIGLGLGLILFAQNHFALLIVLLLSQFLATIHSVLGLFIVFYIFFPKRSPNYSIVWITIIGLILIIITTLNHHEGMVISEGVGWTTNFLENTLMFLILSISIGSFIYIFSRIFLQSSNLKIRFFSFFLMIFGIAGLSNTFIRFILTNWVKVNGYYIEVGNAIIGLGICMLVMYFGNFFSRSKMNKGL